MSKKKKTTHIIIPTIRFVSSDIKNIDKANLFTISFFLSRHKATQLPYMLDLTLSAKTVIY